MAGDTDKCQILQMPPQPHHWCANLDAFFFYSKKLCWKNGNMIHQWQNKGSCFLTCGKKGYDHCEWTVTASMEEWEWRWHGICANHAQALNAFGHTSTGAGTNPTRAKLPTSIWTAWTGVTPTRCLSKQSRFSSRSADRCHTRADIWYWWWHDICGLMAQ